MLQSLNALAGKISPSSPTDSNANKVHMHNNNNVVHHHHPYSKQLTQQPSPASHSSNNNDQKENTWGRIKWWKLYGVPLAPSMSHFAAP
ncbi:hypothetical protein M0802_004059 [Mischocyttarus mexicanus]|nr:hypothetical protein M0802_004059 [Mischocyttarus mexicanus]